jgi:hypothetical protein
MDVMQRSLVNCHRIPAAQLEVNDMLKRFGLVPILMVIFLVVSGLFNVFIKSYFVKTNVTIRSAIYKSPQGCQAKEYTGTSTIKKECLTDQYKITKSRELGFPQKTNSLGYFRINDDAVEVWCLEGESVCDTANIVKNVFVR